jgi:hypothetical protein
MGDTREIAHHRLDRLERDALRQGFGSVVRRLEETRHAPGAAEEGEQTAPPDGSRASLRVVVAQPNEGAMPVDQVLSLLRIMTVRIERLEHHMEGLQCQVPFAERRRRRRLRHGLGWVAAGLVVVLAVHLVRVAAPLVIGSLAPTGASASAR